MVARKRNKRPAKAPEGLSQEDVANRVPCAQATVSKFARRGWLSRLPNGRYPEHAVDEVRERLAGNEQADEETTSWKQRAEAATARLREVQVKLRELELERESGRLVELAVVERDAHDAAERILGVIRAIPQRTAMALECGCRSAAVVEAKIRDEVERAVAELGQSTYAGGKT